MRTLLAITIAALVPFDVEHSETVHSTTDQGRWSSAAAVNVQPGTGDTRRSGLPTGNCVADKPCGARHRRWQEVTAG
jgi:hypothetical protein